MKATSDLLIRILSVLQNLAAPVGLVLLQCALNSLDNGLKILYH